MELIEAQRSERFVRGQKPAADTALANKWALRCGQLGADPAAIVGQRAGQTVGGWLHSSAAKPKDTALANGWANLQLQNRAVRGGPGGNAGQQAGQTAGGWLRQRRKAEKHGVGKRMGEFAAAKPGSWADGGDCRRRQRRKRQATG
ncbi:hypothetical protein [Ruthenibacterium lactatiformans]|uniref:hypothetical protein n=1 Tax=Ruthenibacterium lactatiformans TaxID=1550024 RepID=UPI0039A23502